MKLYDQVKEILTETPETRDNDKLLMWTVWRWNGQVGSEIMRIGQFMAATSPESIRRCRQKIQELHPELAGTERTKSVRLKIAEEKGTHIFREEVKPGPISMFEPERRTDI